MEDYEFEKYCELIDDGGRVNIAGWTVEDVERLMKHYDSCSSVIANKEGVWFKKWTPPIDATEAYKPPTLKEQFKKAPIRTLISLLLIIGYRTDMAKLFYKLSNDR